jgi:hypothetical protein
VTEVRARLANEQGWRDGLDAEALTPEEAESLRTHADAYSAALVELLEMFEYPTESFPSDPWQQYEVIRQHIEAAIERVSPTRG